MLVKKSLSFPLLLVIFFTTTVFLFSAKKKTTVVLQEGKKIMKVAMIIAKNGFRDEEYFQPKEVLTQAGITVDTFSSSTGTAKGMLGATVKVDKTIDELNVDNYDGIIFVGGVGSSEYWDSAKAHKIAQDVVAKNKVLAAICIAPVTLAKAGVLKGKKATVFSSEVSQLKSYGANYTGKDVEVDGKIVTAAGPHAAKQFGEKIRDLLKSK